jgi:hypothetical protein
MSMEEQQPTTSENRTSALMEISNAMVRLYRFAREALAAPRPGPAIGSTSDGSQRLRWSWPDRQAASSRLPHR